MPADHADWFKKEVYVHHGTLRAYLRYYFPSVRDVDDVVQESYLRIWRRHKVTPIESAKAFLFLVARRLAVDWLRHQKASAIETVENLDALSAGAGVASSADVVARAEIVEHLTAAIDALPGRCREVVILRKFELLSTRETALRLGLKEPTVEMQLSRGNARIRDYLEARGITTVLSRAR